MSRARDKLHILLLSTFLCACILFIVFGLIGERSIDAGQDKMSEVGVRRMNMIMESLVGRPVYTEFTVEPNFTWGAMELLLSYTPIRIVACVSMRWLSLQSRFPPRLLH